MTHSLDNLKHYHDEAMKFFASELMILKEVIPKINDTKLAKIATLLISCGQTGSAILQLATQVDTFTGETAMLSRAFMEKITNFCYVSIADEKEYRAFVLHPIYKYYHGIESFKMEDDLSFVQEENIKKRKEKQKKLKDLPIVQEALFIFSETNYRLNWTKKTLNQRIKAIEEWGKLMDVFFRLNKIHYYSDTSEALHGSLYGCTYNLGVFDPEFDHEKEDELEKKLYKENTCALLHLGMLIHESLTLISYSSDINEIWEHSYNNRNRALSLLFHVLERKENSLGNIKNK